MIPHRMLGRENSGVALRFRVAACRKRLRVLRTHRTQLSNSEPGDFQETDFSLARILTTDGTANETELPDKSNSQSNGLAAIAVQLSTAGNELGEADKT